MNTSEKIKKLRIEKGLSQEALGQLVGVQRAAINKYEKGRVVNIKRSTLQKLADALGVSPADLLDDVEHGNHGLSISSGSAQVTVPGNRKRDKQLVLREDAERMEEIMDRTAVRADIWQDRFIYWIAVAIWHIILRINKIEHEDRDQ